MSLDSCSDSSSSDGQESPTLEFSDPFMVTCTRETTDLVYDFIGFRLRSQFKQSRLRGLPREILVPPSQPSSRQQKLRSLAMNLESHHDQLFLQICSKVDLSAPEAERNFVGIAKEIFSTEVNWGRIVSLITFSGVVAHHFVEQEQPSMVQDMIEWLLRFMRDHLISWIIRKGGWDAFVHHFSESKPPKSFWTGVIAMGAIGAAGITLLAMSSK